MHEVVRPGFGAETGQGGLNIAQEKELDLIILDIELPDTNGFEVCKKLKSDPTLADIPVIMMTTRDHAEDVLSGLEVGAIDYIRKVTFDEAVLIETIKQMNVG